MAPLSSGIANAMFPQPPFHLDLNVPRRSLGMTDNATLSNQPILSGRQKTDLQIIAFTLSLFSVVSAVLAFYWFLKMRRIFRHDLIMLLIQSDMFKALWFMTYPIVVFFHGPVEDNSTFCQVNGFFISVGLGASDISVFMIAVHSALYIFYPKPISSGEGGLYPYRRVAYIAWVVYPILMASLAFVNPQDSYVAQGTYCYLPIRPIWYRLALGWIPRYIIFVFILVIYASLYYYVRYRFQGFNRQSTCMPSRHTKDQAKKVKRRLTVPPTPQLQVHGLIPDSRQGSTADSNDPRPSIATLDSHGSKAPPILSGTNGLLWGNLIGNSPGIPSSEMSSEDTDSFTGPSPPQPLLTLPRSPAHSYLAGTSVRSEDPAESRATSWRDTFVHRLSPPAISTKHSIVDLFTMLRHHSEPAEHPSPFSQLQLLNSRGQNFADAEMIRTRDKIRKQLRFLFIYPLVYVGMWILPFVSHVLHLSDKYAENSPFVLTCITTACLCMQAAVDCWLFTTREKPWKHIPGTDGGFWASLKFWSGWTGNRKRRFSQGGPGRTRQEMVRDARAAYERRDNELAVRKERHGVPHKVMGPGRRDIGGARMGLGERRWWEAVGLDGAGDEMSPVAEGRGNAMENNGHKRPDAEEPSSDMEARLSPLRLEDDGRLKDAETLPRTKSQVKFVMGDAKVHTDDRHSGDIT